MVLELLVDPARDEHRSGSRKPLHASGDVHAVAVHTVLVVDDVADVEADPDRDRGVHLEATLDVDGGVHRLYRARKDAEGSVAVELDDLTLVCFDALAEHRAVTIPQRGGPYLVLLHEGRVAHHVREHDRRESSHGAISPAEVASGIGAIKAHRRIGIT